MHKFVLKIFLAHNFRFTPEAYVCDKTNVLSSPMTFSEVIMSKYEYLRFPCNHRNHDTSVWLNKLFICKLRSFDDQLNKAHLVCFF